MSNKTIITVCIIFSLCGLIFWPTLYRYDHIIIQGNTFPVRMNRVTGYTEHYLFGKWVPQEQQTTVLARVEEILPPEEQAKVTGNAGFDIFGDAFVGEIYNGSDDWTITSLILRITVIHESKPESSIKPQFNLQEAERPNPKWERKFKTETLISPLSTGRINISVKSNKTDVPAWSIEEIRGYRGSNNRNR